MKNCNRIVFMVGVLLMVPFFLFGAGQQETASDGKIIIEFFSNLPERNVNQGMLEQKLMDEYLEQNPHVEFKIEALETTPYGQKYQTYIAAGNVPDITTIWGNRSYMKSFEKGYFTPLDPTDYSDYEFFPGMMQTVTYEGNYYGLLRNMDFMFLYYNKGIMDKFGLTPPETMKDFMEMAVILNQNGITPWALNGKDLWTTSMLLSELMLKMTGDYQVVMDCILGKSKFSENDDLLKAVELFQSLVEEDTFQKAFNAADYGAAKNLFAQGQTAFYYMGPWEMGMAEDPNFSDEFKNNLRAVAFPVIKAGKAQRTDLLAFAGAGYGVSADSDVKEEAVKVINYMFRPEGWAKNAWQMGICTPAQKFDKYLTGNETDVQMDILNILNSSTSLSGYYLHISSFEPEINSAFLEKAVPQISAGSISAKRFLQMLDEIVEENQ